MTTDAASPSQTRMTAEPVLNALARAATEGQRAFGEWMIDHMVDGKSSYLPEGGRLVTALPSRVLSPKSVVVMVDLPAETFIQAHRVKFYHPQSNSPKVAASVIQWHVTPSELTLIKPATVVSFGFSLEPTLFVDCILRQYPEIRPKAVGSVGINPFHLFALGIPSQQFFQDWIVKWHDDYITSALEEHLGGDIDYEIEEKIRSLCPLELESDDYMALLRYRTPQEMADASNRIFLGGYNLEGITLPASLQAAARSLESRKSLY